MLPHTDVLNTAYIMYHCIIKQILKKGNNNTHITVTILLRQRAFFHTHLIRERRKAGSYRPGLERPGAPVCIRRAVQPAAHTYAALGELLRKSLAVAAKRPERQYTALRPRRTAENFKSSAAVESVKHSIQHVSLMRRDRF